MSLNLEQLILHNIQCVIWNTDKTFSKASPKIQRIKFYLEDSELEFSQAVWAVENGVDINLIDPKMKDEVQEIVELRKEQI